MSGGGSAAAIWFPISVNRSLRSLDMNLSPQQLRERMRMVEGGWEVLLAMKGECADFRFMRSKYQPHLEMTAAAWSVRWWSGEER